ncbi:hypothetical protein QTO30_12945 [Yoonia sp. GPGPB17]
MKAIFAGLAAAVLITLLSGYGLPLIGFSSAETQSGESVRLD